MIVSNILDKFGAYIDDIDLMNLTKSQIIQLRKLLMDRRILIFNKQKVIPVDLIEITKNFGNLYIHDEEIKYLKNQFLGLVKPIAKNNLPDGHEMHIEKFYDQTPPRISILKLLKIPSKGGETIFADTIKAYDDIPKDLKLKLENNYSLNCSHFSTEITSIHPAVEIHHGTGKKYINVCYSFTKNITNISVNELNQIKEIINDKKYHFYLNWTLDTIAVWDNKGVQHRALANYFPETRFGVRTLTSNLFEEF